MAWLWTHENVPGNGHDKGGHCHLLAHVPADVVPVVMALQRGWLRRITGQPYRVRVIHSKPIGGRLGLEPGETGKLEVEKWADEKIGQTLAWITLDPQTRNANLAISFGSQMFGDQLKPDIAESSAVLAEEIQRAMKGDLSLANRIFTSQAISLDALFTDMARRSGNNMGHYPDAADRYMRLALKAQAACRSTLEALARLHQPREQTVKHVHVNEGGQAVVADHFHQHMGDRENGKSDKQYDATGTAGAIAALPSPNPLGNGVPVPGSEGEATLQNARPAHLEATATPESMAAILRRRRRRQRPDT